MHRALRPQCLVVVTGFLIVATATNAGAAQVEWWTDFDKAAAEAERSQKPLLLEATASWCGHCHKMFEQTFTHEDVVRHVNSCFVPVVIDADRDEKVVETLGISAFPTTLIVSPKLELLGKFVGFLSADEMAQHLQGHCSGGHVDQPLPYIAARPEKRPAPPAALAFDGLCLVSLRDEERLRTGSPAHISTYNGRRVIFATAEHKRRFDANPLAYWPVRDGHCAVTAATARRNQPGNPRWAVIYTDRLWFFSDAVARQAFLEEPQRFPAEPRRETASRRP